MRSHSVPDLEDRLSQANEAKKAMLAKFKRPLDHDDPATIAKRLQREAIVAARAQRAAEREIKRRQQEQERARQAELAAQAAAEAQRVAAEQAAREAAVETEREAALKAEQKAASDVRYAARKAAKKHRRRGY